MGLCLDKTKAYFDSKELHYREVQEGKALRVGFSAMAMDNMQRVDITVFFGDDDKDVAVRVFDICKFPEEKRSKMFKVCSTLNAKFRWIKFYVDKSDNTINAANDAVVSPDTAGSEVFELVMRTCSIVDEAYPELMKAMWA